jgi:nucleoside-diphosphate-sugar epimerase
MFFLILKHQLLNPDPTMVNYQHMSDLSFFGSRILVVGGAGFVGSNLVHQLLEQSPKEIIVVDNLLSSDVVNIPADKRVRFVFGSITNDKILSELPDDLDFAFHLACYHGNQSSIADPLADHDNNTLTSLKLFERLKDIKGLKKVVYAAAACAVAEKTYDEPTATTEDQPVTLYHDSPYSISKIIGELYGNYYFKQHQLPFVKARFSNVYGPREILGAGQWRGTIHTVWRNVTPTFIWRSLHGDALPLDNGGNASRDFIFVEDMARGLMACALKGSVGDVYNLATGQETSILELATFINEFTGNRTPLDLRPARDWDRSGKRFASTAKAEAELNFRAEVDIREGIERTVLWTRSNMLRIEQTIAQHSKLSNQCKKQ